MGWSSKWMGAIFVPWCFNLVTRWLPWIGQGTWVLWSRLAWPRLFRMRLVSPESWFNRIHYLLKRFGSLYIDSCKGLAPDLVVNGLNDLRKWVPGVKTQRIWTLNPIGTGSTGPTLWRITVFFYLNFLKMEKKTAAVLQKGLSQGHFGFGIVVSTWRQGGSFLIPHVLDVFLLPKRKGCKKHTERIFQGVLLNGWEVVSKITIVEGSISTRTGRWRPQIWPACLVNLGGVFFCARICLSQSEMMAWLNHALSLKWPLENCSYHVSVKFVKFKVYFFYSMICVKVMFCSFSIL